MFNKKLTEVTNNIQRTIDTCCTEKNIAFSVQRQIDTFSDYVYKLDPSEINFQNTGIFGKSKIKAYWSKFQSMVYGLEKCIKEFSVQKKVVQNTLITLQNQCKNAEQTIEKVKQQNDGEPIDTEFSQQYAVVGQSLQMLKNMIAEYTVLSDKLEAIQNISVQVFQQAILIAKKQTDFSKFDTTTYASNYKQLKDMM